MLWRSRRIGVIVGNGLTLDLLKYSTNGLRVWHTGNPLRWNISHPEDTSIKLVDWHATLGPAYRKLRSIHPNEGDFALIEKLLDAADEPANRYRSATARELRNYLARAFSQFQLMHDEVIGREYHAFPWGQWLGAHAADIRIVVSYNYDLFAERLLRDAGIEFYRMPVDAQRGVVPVVKPHSSIDFGPVGFDIKGGPVYLDNNDFPQRVLSTEEMLANRVELSLVLPGEPSSLQGLQWVKPGLDQFELIGRELTHLIIIGLSYWRSDRAELNALVDGLPSDVSIVMADPSPNSEWVKHLQSQGRSVIPWTNGPQRMG